MEKNDSLRKGNEVTVTIWGPGDECLYKSTGSDFHTLESAVSETVSEANLSINPEDCVFEIANDTTGVTHRYRLNAHGHLKLII